MGEETDTFQSTSTPTASTPSLFMSAVQKTSLKLKAKVRIMGNERIIMHSDCMVRKVVLNL